MATPPPEDLGAVSPAIGPLPSIYIHLRTPIGGTMSDIPADLRYSPDHLWVRPGTGGGRVRVGVTDFAQQSLGDVVQVTLPDLGETIKAGEACGDVESVKSVNDLVAPVAGTIRARNDDRVGLLGPDRQRAHRRGTRIGAGHLPGRHRHRSGPAGTYRPRRQGQRHPAQVARRRLEGRLGVRDRSGTPRLRQLCRLRRPGRQYLGAPGDRLPPVLNAPRWSATAGRLAFGGFGGEQATVERLGHRGGAVADAELRVDVQQVRLDCRLADEQAGRRPPGGGAGRPPPPGP